MNHELVLENSSSAAANTLPNTVIYLKTVKYLNIRLRQIYQTNLELKERVQKIEDRMLYYGCKALELLTAWKVSKYGVISGPCFPVFELNTEIYEVNLRIQSE